MRRVLLAATFLLAASVGGAELQPDRLSTVDLLRQATEQSTQGDRARAKLTDEASARVNELIEALEYEDDDVRVSAAWGLRYAGHRKVVAPLIESLRDANFGIGRAAAVSLRQFQSPEQPLRDMMRDADPKLRWRALMNAEYMKLQGLMEEIAGLALRDPVDFIRADAAWTLRHAGGQEVVETLIKCLADPYARTRRHARIALRGAVAAELAKEGSPVRERALETLLWVLANHGDKPYATSQAVELLTKLAVERLGTDPHKWRELLKTQEGKR